MKVYLLRFKAELNWREIPDVDAKHTAKDVAEALRDAADELEDYSDWRIETDTEQVDPVVLEVDRSPYVEIQDNNVRKAAADYFGIKYMDIGDIAWTCRDYSDVDFPDWALCALVNGDPLEDAEDRAVYEAWTKRMLDAGYDLLSPDVLDDHNEFRAYPAFGKACSTTRVRLFKKEEDDE